MTEVIVYFFHGSSEHSLRVVALSTSLTASSTHGLRIQSHRLHQLPGQDALRVLAYPPAGQLPVLGQGGAGVDQSAVFDDVAESIGVPQLGDVGFRLTIKNQDIGKVIGFDATQLALQLQCARALLGGAVDRL